MMFADDTVLCLILYYQNCIRMCKSPLTKCIGVVETIKLH